MKKILSKIVDRIILTVSSKQYAKLALKRAVNEAKKKWLESGKQHFVIFSDGSYLVINKRIVDKLNSGKYKKNKITHRQLMDMSVYVTPVSGYVNI